jgi:hypothetical protein
MTRAIQAALLLAAAVAMHQGTMAAETSKMPAPSMPTRMVTPEGMAVEAYNNGVSHRDKGRSLSRQSPRSSGR